MCKGFKQISNDFFESDYWRQSRTYNECEAVLDIINQVRFEASERFARIGGREVMWSQAQWPASVRFLAARWHWTERRVRTFISHLRRKGIIETDDSQGVNIITLKRYLVFAENMTDTASDTQSDTANTLNINELNSEVTQPLTQQVTQPDCQKPPSGSKRHSGDTKHNSGNNSSSLRSELTLFTCAESEFGEWLSTHCPYIAAHLKPMTANEYNNLKIQFGEQTIRDVCEKIENRIDLRKKYSNLYRTLLNWLKREHNETATKRNVGNSSVAPTNEELINTTYDLINEARARENLSDSI